jgi:glycosyltransferase involved in cell wall biosynthesis
MSSTELFIVVDPILRGSRLFFSWIAASCLQRYGRVIILTRSQGLDEHGEELFRDLNVEIESLVQLPDDFWFGLIPKDGVGTVIASIAELSSRHVGELRGIYFSGVKEFCPALHDLVAMENKVIAEAPTLFVEYDFEHLMRRMVVPLPTKWLPRLKRLFRLRKLYSEKRMKMSKLLGGFPNGKFGILDERVFDEEFSRKKDQEALIDLPDPGPSRLLASVLPSHGKNARAVKEPLRLLLVGIQSRRKGLVDVVKAVRHSEFPRGRIKIVVYGRLDDEVESLRGQLLGLSGQIEWHEGYFEESVIQEQYALADYVVLPYAPDYQGSSGVFAFSLAYGRPVLASSHGCIGFRARKFRVGKTYTARNTESFVDALKKLPHPTSSEYQEMSENAFNYSTARSVEAHQTVIKNFFKLE